LARFLIFDSVCARLALIMMRLALYYWTAEIWTDILNSNSKCATTLQEHLLIFQFFALAHHGSWEPSFVFLEFGHWPFSFLLHLHNSLKGINFNFLERKRKKKEKKRKTKKSLST